MKDWKFAFLKTVPVMFGYLALGMAFGILMQQEGYSALWSALASVVIFAGSMQFLLVSLLSSGASLTLAAIMTLLINSRHLFYGLSFIEKFKKLGKERQYLIFSLTDETYSVLCSLPEGTDTPSKMVKIAALDQLYWVVGSLTGGLLGEIIPFDTTGIDFSMTALFIVIFTEQLLLAKSKLPALVGLISAIVFLIVLGPDAFILPSLIATVTILLSIRGTVERKMEAHTV
ncbi:MAG: AzlC family ABC transporter permease [Oscillospiraceae bacterium]